MLVADATNQMQATTGLHWRSSAARFARALPAGTLAVGGGLAVLGATSYGYLIVAARGLDQQAFARLSIVWMALFTLGPGLFLPLEQAIAQRLAAQPGSRSARVLVRRAGALGCGLAAGITGLCVLAWPWLGARLFDHDAGLFVALVLATCALVPVHVTRGVLAGTGRFPRYGAQLALDGVLRLVGAGLLAGLGVRSAAAYGGVLVASQLVAVALTVGGHTCRAWAIDLATDAEAEQAGDPMPWRMIAHALGWMLVGTTVAQVLVNGGTVVVKAFSDPGDAAAGHFLTAVVLTRIPLFLYAALQASLLPGLSRRLADNDVVGARRGLRTILSIVFWFGTMTTVILLAVGPQLDALLFGPSFRIARLPVVLLSVGSTVYLLAATLAQALLATRAVRETAWCWIAGAVAFGVSLPLPGTVAMRASTSLLIGAAVACACFAVAVRARFARLAVSEAATDLVLATW